MNINDWMKFGGAIASFLVVTVLGKRLGWYDLVGGTNKLLKEQNIELRNSNELKDEQIKTLQNQHEEDVKAFTASHLESQKAISKLQGQIDQLSTLQLSRVADTLDEMKRLLQASSDRLLTDTKAAKVAAEHVKTDLENSVVKTQNVEEQIVENQTVNNQEKK